MIISKVIIVNDLFYYFDLICPALCFIFCIVHSVISLIIGKKQGKKFYSFCENCLQPKFVGEEHSCSDIPFFDSQTVVFLFVSNYYSICAEAEHNCWSNWTDREAVRLISLFTNDASCVSLCEYLLQLDDLQFASTLSRILLKYKDYKEANR